MGKLFDIFGNLAYDNATEKLKSSFSGRIVIDGDKIFGYCEDFSVCEGNMQSQLCFLTGMTLGNDEFDRGIVIYKLSNDPHCDPIMLLSTDIRTNNNSGWSKMDTFGHFTLQGKAELTFEEIAPFPSRIHEVCELFGKIDKTVGSNSELIYKPEDCEKYIAKAMAV